jgi:hypothetical protein
VTYNDVVRRGTSSRRFKGGSVNPQEAAPNKKIATIVYMNADIPSLRICDVVGRSKISLTGLYVRSDGSRMKNKTPFLHIFRNDCSIPAKQNMKLSLAEEQG